MSQEKSSPVDLTTIHPESIRKWGQIFKFFNSGSAEGQLTQDDYERISRSIVSNKKIPAEKVKKAAKMFLDLWKSIHGEKQSMSREQFVDDVARMQLYHAGTKALTLSRAFTHLFHSIDFNSDGYVDMEEFLIFSKATGFKNEESIKRAFRAIDVNGDGKISEDEYVDAFVKYDLDASVKMEDLPIYGLP